ncbi:TPA: hypothetical protein ACKQES_004964 [Serratia marcescens]
MKRIVLFLFVFSISLGTLAEAAEARVCKSRPVFYSESLNVRLDDNTIFRCSFGSKTIPELARDGWGIVQVSNQSDFSDARETAEYFELIIQKP